MIKKQNLLFLTLFSLVLVLGVYYITMPDQVLVENKGIEESVLSEIVVIDNEYLTALELELDDERQKLKTTLESKLNDTETTIEEKNNAYLELKQLDEIKGQEELIEKKLLEVFNINTFVKINDNNISVIAIGDTHDIELANEMMNSIQKEYDSKKIVSIKFEK